MKKATFKKPFNGIDNALNLIPESYKINGNEFEVTDGIETYRVRWDGSLTEGKGAVLTANNQTMINEDMQKIKHLMNFSSKETLGNLKGSERIDENKSFKDVWGKTKEMLSESKDNREVINEMDGGYGFTSENNFGDNEIEEKEVTEMDMPNSDNQIGEMQDVVTNEEVIEEMEGDGEEATNNRDVQNVQDILSSNSVVMAAMNKINTRGEKIELAKGLIKAISNGDSTLISKIAREVLADANAQSDIKGDDTAELANDSNLNQQVGMNESIEEGCGENPIRENSNGFLADAQHISVGMNGQLYTYEPHDVDSSVYDADSLNDWAIERVKQDNGDGFVDSVEVVDNDGNAYDVYEYESIVGGEGEGDRFDEIFEGMYESDDDVNEELSADQSDEMDTDKDGDIDAKDLKNLRDDK